MVKFGLSVFYFFGPSVINLVLRFSIYSVLRIWSNGPARDITVRWCDFSTTTAVLDVCGTNTKAGALKTQGFLYGEVKQIQLCS